LKWLKGDAESWKTEAFASFFEEGFSEDSDQKTRFESNKAEIESKRFLFATDDELNSKLQDCFWFQLQFA
jgi:hypothetical protein